MPVPYGRGEAISINESLICVVLSTFQVHLLPSFSDAPKMQARQVYLSGKQHLGISRYYSRYSRQREFDPENLVKCRWRNRGTKQGQEAVLRLDPELEEHKREVVLLEPRAVGVEGEREKHPHWLNLTRNPGKCSPL